MSNAFEQPPISDQGEIEPSAEQQEFSPEHLTLLHAIDAIQPTGDVVADAREYDRITNAGELHGLFSSPERSLQILRNLRDTYAGIHDPRDASTFPFRTVVRTKGLAALDRILAYYEAR